jgi:hypothetical protein
VRAGEDVVLDPGGLRSGQAVTPQVPKPNATAR